MPCNRSDWRAERYGAREAPLLCQMQGNAEMVCKIATTFPALPQGAHLGANYPLFGQRLSEGSAYIVPSQQ